MVKRNSLRPPQSRYWVWREGEENPIDFTHEKAKDIHESDTSHLKESYKAACDLVAKYDWCEIKCVKDGQIRSIEDIHEEIYEEIKKFL